MNNSFLSLVEEEGYPDYLSVRARVDGDLQRAFGRNIKVYEDEGTDYKYRTFLKKEYVAKIIANKIQNINYDNFKDSVPKEDIPRYNAYMKIWSAMWNLQEYLNPHKIKWYENYMDYEK